jgi:hypothetical protein
MRDMVAESTAAVGKLLVVATVGTMWARGESTRKARDGAGAGGGGGGGGGAGGAVTAAYSVGWTTANAWTMFSKLPLFRKSVVLARTRHDGHTLLLKPKALRIQALQKL